MAAQAMEPARPVIRTINIKANNSGQSRSLDPVVLSQKLEAARREQDASNTRRERRLATRNGTFVARTNTHSSNSTTTPPPPAMISETKPPNPLAMNPPHISPSVAHHAQSIMDGRPVMTHKSMFAALNLGLADLEAMTERLEQETTKQREFLCSRCKTPDPQSPGHHHDHPTDNFSRPKSLPASSARQAPTIQHSGYDCPQPPYECFELPAADDPLPPQYHAISYRASEDTPRSNFAQRSPAAYRPQPSHTQPLDQRDWTPQTPNHADQSSRDSMFNVPSGYIFRRRNKSTTAPAGSNMNAAKTPNAANIPPPPPPPQQEMHLISDAVKLIKAKERQRRRKSVIDFLKKL